MLRFQKWCFTNLSPESGLCLEETEPISAQFHSVPRLWTNHRLRVSLRLTCHWNSSASLNNNRLLLSSKCFRLHPTVCNYTKSFQCVWSGNMTLVISWFTCIQLALLAPQTLKHGFFWKFLIFFKVFFFFLKFGDNASSGFNYRNPFWVVSKCTSCSLSWPRCVFIGHLSKRSWLTSLFLREDWQVVCR